MESRIRTMYLKKRHLKITITLLSYISVYYYFLKSFICRDTHKLNIKIKNLCILKDTVKRIKLSH